RKFFIHTIYNKIKKIEIKWKTNGKKNETLKKFLKYKKIYMKRSKWYKNHVHNNDFYTYEPHYIENIKKPGPYIKKQDIYGNNSLSRNYVKFEGKKYECPINPNNVLTAFYNTDWNKSPYKSIEELINSNKESNDKNMYSADIFDSTLYKHVKAVHIKDKDYLSEK
ncbi:MAG: hypothetical protein PUD10_10110, partial [Lachnospira sp.]|nr:hypothetical protein [Lachnospira sp.]